MAGASVKSWPVPARLTVCVLPATPSLLSVMVSMPLRFPPAVGVKVTLIVQLPPAATLEPQLFVCSKSPVMEMLTVSAASPPLVKVTDCALLVELTSSLPKLRLLAERLTAGESESFATNTSNEPPP